MALCHTEDEWGMRLFMYEEPKSSVRHRSSCLWSEVISFLYATSATWHSVIPLEDEFGIGLYLCIFTMKIQKILVKRES